MALLIKRTDSRYKDDFVELLVDDVICRMRKVPMPPYS